MSGFQLQRLGLVMEPEPGNPLEVEGVLNPAAARGPDGDSGVSLGTPEDWRWHSTHSDTARLADRVSRRERTEQT